MHIFNSVYSHPGDENFFNERAKDLIRIWNTYAILSFRKSASYRSDSIARLNEIISSSRREFFEDFSIGRMVGRFDIMDNFELEGIEWKEQRGVRSWNEDFSDFQKMKRKGRMAKGNLQDSCLVGLGTEVKEYRAISGHRLFPDFPPPPSSRGFVHGWIRQESLRTSQIYIYISFEDTKHPGTSVE